MARVTLDRNENDVTQLVSYFNLFQFKKIFFESVGNLLLTNKGTTKDEMAGWHHRLHGREFG